MHVVASHLRDQPGGGPHADAPAAPWVVGIRPDVTGPVGLVGELPEVLGTPHDLGAGIIFEGGADTMRTIMVAFIVAISGAFAFADVDGEDGGSAKEGYEAERPHGGCCVRRGSPVFCSGPAVNTFPDPNWSGLRFASPASPAAAG